MNSNIEKIVKVWKNQGIKLQESIQEAEVRLVFKAAGLNVSDDVILLYSLCGGMSENTSDNHFFELWSPQYSLQEAHNFSKPFVPFADGLISAHIFCLKFENQGQSSVWIYYPGLSDSPTNLASSLNEAFGFLLNEPSKLHLPSASLTHH